jgi:hypothetical protein
MKELIQQQQILKRHRFSHNLALNIHGYILPVVGAGLMTTFYNINNTLSLAGCVILLYVLTVGVGLIVPYCNNRSYDIEKELQQLSDRLKQIEAINRSLDEHRDRMLFDNDPDYWQILEKLAISK